MTLILDDGQILTSHTTQADAHGCKGYSIGEFTSTYPQPFKVQVNVFYKERIILLNIDQMSQNNNQY